MANKVTKETLKMLIEEVLNDTEKKKIEEISFPIGKTTSYKDIKTNLKAIDSDNRESDDTEIDSLTDDELKKLKTLAKIADDDGVIGYNDISSIDTPGDYKHYQNVLKALIKPKFIEDAVLDVSDDGLSEPKDKFSFDLNRIPKDLKNIILRTFKISVNDLASLSESSMLKEDENKLDWEDFSVILKNKKHPLYRQALNAMKQGLNIFDQKSKEFKTFKELYPFSVDDSQTSQDELTPSTPTVDLSDLHGAERKNVPSYVVSAFNSMGLGTTNSLKERIQFLNSFTEKIASKNYKKGSTNISELMGSISVMNSLARIVKRMDDKAAGWAFESFLAQLVNGTTEGTAMGAADFVYGIAPNELMPEGTKGSAKLLSSYEFTQSSATTNEVIPRVGDKIAYIVGIKKDKSKSTTATPSDIVSVDIHLLYLERIKENKGSKNANYRIKDSEFKVIGGEQKKQTKTEIKVKVTKDSYIGTINLSADLSNLDKLGKIAIDSIDKNIPKLINNMEQFSRSSKGYLTSGKAEDVNKAVDGYAALFSLINDVFGDKSEYSKETGVSAGVEASSSGVTARQAKAIEEQKITANYLKKIIEESFKKNK